MISGRNGMLEERYIKRTKPPYPYQTRASSKQRLPTLPLLRSTISVTGLNLLCSEWEEVEPGAVVT